MASRRARPASTPDLRGSGAGRQRRELSFTARPGFLRADRAADARLSLGLQRGRHSELNGVDAARIVFVGKRHEATIIAERPAEKARRERMGPWVQQS